MLNCSYCDYYSYQKGKKVCEFSDHLFVKNPTDMDKYPCEGLTFHSYLEKQRESIADVEIVA